MLLLFLDSGLRRAEMANLRFGDLDLEGKRVRVIGKGGKIGIVPFSSRTAKALIKAFNRNYKEKITKREQDSLVSLAQRAWNALFNRYS